MEYILNDLEKDIRDCIDAYGYKEPVTSVIRALIEYAHQMSDMGLKERAIKAMAVVDLLKDVRDKIDE